MYIAESTKRPSELRTLTVTFDPDQPLAPILNIVAEHGSTLDDMTPGTNANVRDEGGHWVASLSMYEGV